ncbi:MAG: hypothetical protein RL518_2150 [Pseudomonadota bacterium]
MTIMFLILLGLFLTLAAFALDLGNLYLWRLRLDKAARAGSLAGLGFRGIHGWTYVTTPSGSGALIDATKEAVQDNFKAYGIALQADDIDVAYNSDQDSIAVSVNHNPSTILIGRLSGILGFGFNAPKDAAGNTPPQSGILNISRQHQANLNRANVVLLIDVSGSMLCPTDEPCSCRRANNCNPTGTTKLDRLAEGVKRFAQHFNPQQDRISVIAFNLAAQQLYSIAGRDVMQNATSTHPLLQGTTAREFLRDEKGNLLTVLEALAGSNTNHCDALAEGIRELELLSVQLFGNDDGSTSTDRRLLQPFVVFFTDGAPNAMRGIIPTTDIPSNSCATYSNGVRTPSASCVASGAPNDFYHYALEWASSNGANTSYYRGPGPFVARKLDANNVPTLFNFTIGSNQVAPVDSQTCGVEVADGDPTKFEQTVTKRQVPTRGAGERGDPTNGCLSATTTEFSFSIPYTNPDTQGGFTGTTYGASVSGVPISSDTTTWIDPNWPTAFFPSAIPYGLQKYDELPYYCAIEAADYIRTRFAGTIFAIGLGTPDAHLATGGQGATCADPLQDPDDHTSRKDFFLTRLAFASSMFGNQLLPTSVAPYYQVAGAQSSRDVSGCSDHRLKNGTNPPQPKVGYTSTDTLADGNTTYLDLRPLRPTSMDTVFTDGRSVRRMETQGEYFPTDNADEIPRIFDRIAKTILLRSSS